MLRNFREYFSPLRGNLLVLAISMVIWNFTIQMIKTYEALYIFSLGGTGAVFSLIAAIQLVLGVFLRILGGYIADIYGRKRIIGVVTILTSVAYLFYIFATNWTWILVGASLSSFTHLYGPALEAIRADSVRPKERGRGFVLLTNLPKIPAIVAPTMGGLFIAEKNAPYGINLQGVRLGFLLLSLGMLTAGVIRFLFLKETLSHQTVQDKNHGNIDVGIFREFYETVAHSDRSIKRLVVLNGFFMFSFHFGVSFRCAYAVGVKGLSTYQWGVIESVSQVFMIANAFIIGNLIDRYGRRRTFIPSIIVLAIAASFFILSNSFTSFLISMVITYTGLMSRMMALQVLIADSIPKTKRGRILSTINILGNFGTQGSIIISGLLYDLSPALPFYAAIFMYAIATLVALRFLEEPIIRQL